MADWARWHQEYEDPTSDLSARLAVVRRFVGQSLDALERRPLRVLSLCCGEGRDLLPALAARPELDADVLLVELDPVLAGRAEAQATELGAARVTVRVADAGDPATFASVLPVDLLLLCGIFGNVADDDIRRTLGAVRHLVEPGGLVLWTRGWFEHVDLRPQVRRWSLEAGLEEIAYEGEPATFGVGWYRVPDAPVPPGGLPERLFTFVW